MHKQTHDFIWNIIVEVNCECICEAACVLTYECVSQFCLNEGGKKERKNDDKNKAASNTLPCVYVLVQRTKGCHDTPTRYPFYRPK